MLDILIIISVVFIERKKPGEALLWAVIIAALPAFGVVLYVAFASTIWIKITSAVRNEKLNKQQTQALLEQIEMMKNRRLPLLEGMNEKQQQNIRFNLRCSRSLLTQHNEVQIITSGKEKFKKMFEDMNNAEESIHVVYYGLHNDKVGEAFVDLLTKKAKEGVKVRVLYDGMGSVSTPKKFFKELQEAGGRALAIKSMLTHFRNHRKIVVIDGKVAYTGGMNVGKKYVGELKNKSPWRDTQIRVRGDGAAILQSCFLYDWFYANPRKKHGINETELLEMFPGHEIDNVLPCQFVASGIESENEIIKLSYLRLISSAKRRIVIQTPYFIPDESVMNALMVAVVSGVEIILMVPGKKSNFFLEPVTTYNIAKLLPYGVKVFKYNGYIHAKTMTIDDDITCIGSVNMDVRSLEIDDEIFGIFYDDEFNKTHSSVLNEDFKNCTELDYEAVKNRNIFKKFFERIWLLFSPLM